MTGIHAFDQSNQESNLWLKAVMGRLNTDDQQVAYTALKATLHALRDRIRPESAVHLGAQLPMTIRGLFYEGWHMAGTPTKERHTQQFLEHVGSTIPQGMDLDPEEAARAVFDVMWEKVDTGEISKLIRLFPLELRDLWPVLAQVEAAEAYQ